MAQVIKLNLLQRSVSTMLTAALTLRLAIDASGALPSREDRVKCPYYQTSGCLLDAMEKTCEDAVDGPSEAHDLLNPESQESLWMCCCPRPYMACAERDADAECLSDISALATTQLTQS